MGTGDCNPAEFKISDGETAVNAEITRARGNSKLRLKLRVLAWPLKVDRWRCYQH